MTGGYVRARTRARALQCRCRMPLARSEGGPRSARTHTERKTRVEPDVDGIGAAASNPALH